MTDETTDPGDGAGINILVPRGEEEMDLPANVSVLLISESASNIQANNRDGRNVGTMAMGVLQGAMARNFDELGISESRATSGVLATPVASPATQSG